MSVKRYFLRETGGKEKEVSMLDYARAEQLAGIPTGAPVKAIRVTPVSSGFAGDGMSGFTETVEIEEIMDKF